MFCQNIFQQDVSLVYNVFELLFNNILFVFFQVFPVVVTYISGSLWGGGGWQCRSWTDITVVVGSLLGVSGGTYW